MEEKLFGYHMSMFTKFLIAGVHTYRSRLLWWESTIKRYGARS